jgi:hypothetical protein
MEVKASFTLLPLYPQYLLDMMLGRPQRLYGCSNKGKSVTLLGIKPDHPVNHRTDVIFCSELFWHVRLARELTDQCVDW